MYFFSVGDYIDIALLFRGTDFGMPLLFSPPVDNLFLLPHRSTLNLIIIFYCIMSELLP